MRVRGTSFRSPFSQNKKNTAYCARIGGLQNSAQEMGERREGGFEGEKDGLSRNGERKENEEAPSVVPGMPLWHFSEDKFKQKNLPVFL